MAAARNAGCVTWQIDMGESATATMVVLSGMFGKFPKAVLACASLFSILSLDLHVVLQQNDCFADFQVCGFVDIICRCCS